MAKIKICGLSRDVDIEYANEAKPDYVGFIIGIPKSRRNIEHAAAKRLKGMLDKNIKAVGVFIDYPTEKIAQLVNDNVIDIVQLHGNEDESYILKLKKLIPNKEIWKAFVINSKYDIIEAQQCSADKILLDSGTGCGKTFDWNTVKDVQRNFILAGGLNPENIPKAIEQVNPWAVDLSSGVETDGFKSREKMLKAVKAAKSLI